MNSEIKKEWVSDLRDGTRRQGKDQLRNKYGRQCCLDVLCEQAVRKGIIAEPVLDDRGYVYNWKNDNYEDCEEYEVLPSIVMEWAELTAPNPAVWYNGDLKELSYLNDDLEEDFETIAGLIEESL